MDQLWRIAFTVAYEQIQAAIDRADYPALDYWSRRLDRVCGQS